jgi:hypothetical protein
VVKYHGLARRYLLPPRFLMRPLLNGGTFGQAEKRSCKQKQALRMWPVDDTELPAAVVAIAL